MSATPSPPPTPQKEDKGKISIAVTIPGEEPLTFKVKLTTAFSKIYDALASQRGIARDSFSLSYDGERINPTQTPKMLEMSDGDQVDVQITQVGGRG